MSLTYEQQRDQIIATLDYTRISRTMAALNWRWVGSPTIPPSISDMQATVRHLLDNAHRTMTDKPLAVTTIETGGFLVIGLRLPDGGVTYYVHFSVTDADGASLD